MKNQKIAIIGAGICGLYLARKLSEKGHDITVFEKKDKIGNEVCSGLFSQRILEFLPESRELIQNKISFVLLHFPKKTITVRFSKDFFIMSHFELDELAGSLAQKAGAEIILNHSISSLPQGYDKIIGCDGVNSYVRGALNLPDPKYRLGILGYVKKPCSVDYVEVWPIKSGFIWKIPRGDRTEYGIIAKLQESKKLFDEFLTRNKILLEWVRAKTIPQGFIIPSHSSITLCGDAAGLTKPWSGGGVIWGLTAAEMLIKSFPDFLAYRKTARKFFIPKIIMSKIGIKIVNFTGFKIPWLLPKNNRIESDFLLK